MQGPGTHIIIRSPHYTGRAYLAVQENLFQEIIPSSTLHQALLIQAIRRYIILGGRVIAWAVIGVDLLFNLLFDLLIEEKIIGLIQFLDDVAVFMVLA